MKDKINVISSEYIISAVSIAQYPQIKLPEIVFIGRSNVGKSSLINSLTRRKNLARVSQTPGKTQTINFYKVNLKITESEEVEPERRDFYLVDLPGYGYAKTSKSNRKLWAKFIEQYLLSSEQIGFVCQLIDIRHEPMESDINMFNWLIENNLPVLIIATKSDKISKTAQIKQVSIIKKAFGIEELPVLPYSSIKSEGRSELLDTIADSLLKY
ncbi:MAG: YihA family ribosome biogenesis GTP-binding protein [Selenomonadaceae bacterium]|nr:YihA family ribosome biogenesis GTP-binding protein [Selenomonadaceae bacterium]